MIKSTVTECRECGSAELTWQTHNRMHPGTLQQGRLNTNEVQCLFVLGCDACSETLSVITADKMADMLNSHKLQFAGLKIVTDETLQPGEIRIDTP
ncbi:hypothetical protein [Pseudomonas aeruginosa]|uniref:hypothetical protein n=1 Tax=Pseudomonas aeruginosa TaxID=287 RepID=UPI00159E2D9F|nr:hypothetical protein [Pseudomonas aeruginosa]